MLDTQETTQCLCSYINRLNPYLLFTRLSCIHQLKCLLSNFSQFISICSDGRTVPGDKFCSHVMGKGIWGDLAWLRPHIPFPSLTLWPSTASSLITAQGLFFCIFRILYTAYSKGCYAQWTPLSKGCLELFLFLSLPSRVHLKLSFILGGGVEKRVEKWCLLGQRKTVT